jgi:hypothetical protein
LTLLGARYHLLVGVSDVAANQRGPQLAALRVKPAPERRLGVPPKCRWSSDDSGRIVSLRRQLDTELFWEFGEHLSGSAQHDFDVKEQPLRNEDINDLNRNCTGHRCRFKTTDPNPLKPKGPSWTAFLDLLISSLQIRAKIRIDNSFIFKKLEPPARIELATC